MRKVVCWLVLLGVVLVWQAAARWVVPGRIVDYFRTHPTPTSPTTNLLISAGDPLPVSFYLDLWHTTWSPRCLAMLLVVGGLLCLTAGGRRPDRLLWFGSVSAVALVGLPMFTRAVYVGGDTLTLHLPLRSFYARSLAAGTDPTWCPHLFCGFDLHGEGQQGLFHPLHWLLFRWLALDLAFNAELALSYLVLVAGTYALFRVWDLPRAAAVFGAFTFAFSAATVTHYIHINVMTVTAHLPWLLVCCQLLRVQSDRRVCLAACVAIALLTASQALLGHPQYLWISTLAESLMIGWLALHERTARPALLYGMAKAIGLLLGGVQLIPTAVYALHSTRAQATPAEMALGSLHPLNVIQWVFPYALIGRSVPDRQGFSEAMYLGVVPIVLLCWLAARRNIPVLHRPVLQRAALLVLVGSVLALGEYSPLYSLISRLPVLGQFRGPGRYILLADLGLAAASAVAFAALQASAAGTRAVRVAAALALAAAFGVVAVKGYAGAQPGFRLGRSLAGWPRVLIGPGWLLGSLALLDPATRGRRLALTGLVLLHLCDLLAYDLTFMWDGEPRLVRLSQIPRLLPLPPGSASWRVQPAFTSNAVVLLGAREYLGYVALYPSKVLRSRQPAAMRLAGLKWIQPRPGVRTWLELPDPLPRVRLVTQAIPSADPARDVARIDLRTSTLAEASIPLPGGPPGTASLLADRPGDIRVRTVALSRQILVLSESHSPGWQVSRDGHPAPLLRLNGDSMGCLVEPGIHEVHFHWQPESLRLGFLASLAGMLALASWAIAWLAIGKRTPRSRPDLPRA